MFPQTPSLGMSGEPQVPQAPKGRWKESRGDGGGVCVVTGRVKCKSVYLWEPQFPPLYKEGINIVLTS